ncbi:hypothetical protein [Maribacter sp. 4G9]|uniref:hypothetical protein n=1 Tax=Maribacter sp. 4G9 TaxID=1889777 RepID=UPI000C1586F0|nr:hypothetical protein [Maribacter sp. 4G9]PIB29171.1 hypothetical protein BFP75_03920 [Maribacter sp. 4G9]
MKESISFSAEDKEKTSLNFFELRQKGIEYIQELSGENWTDFNDHDPGVTILEQLCYAMTDVAMRTSCDMKDLLSSNKLKEDNKDFAEKNAFYAPSEIYNTHPVTNSDLRKVLIDQFPEIQNIWISEPNNNGLEEKLVLISRIDILIYSFFYHQPIGDNRKEEIKKFIASQRSLGEDVQSICFLESRYMPLKMEVQLASKYNFEIILANFFVALFEYVYTPISQYSMVELLEDGYTKAEILSGPKLKNGFIKTTDFKDRLVFVSSKKIEEWKGRSK